MSLPLKVPECFGAMMPLAAPEPTPGAERDAGVEALDAAEALGVVLDLRMQTSRATRWCWASTTASVATFLGRGPYTPCQVATLCLGSSMNCCTSMSPRGHCDEEYAMQTALEDTRCFAEARQKALEYNEIVEQIRLNRPVCCHIKWSSTFLNTGGHFNVIVGYMIGSQDVVVRDTDVAGDQILSHRELVTNYRRSGRWDFTLLTK